MCPSRTFLLVAVLGCNIVLFIYNFPGLVGVVPSVTQFNSSWLDKKEVSDLLQKLEDRIMRLEQQRSSSGIAPSASPSVPAPPATTTESKEASQIVPTTPIQTTQADDNCSKHQYQCESACGASTAIGSNCQSST